MVGTLALGKYRLVRSLGRGSNAEVFLAEPIRHPDRLVVVKRVHDHVVSHARFPALFEAEVRSMADFQHPYAVRFIEAAFDGPTGPCLVLEYVPGLTLEAVLRRDRVLHPVRVGRMLGHVAHALQAAHDAGIVHRDLKPANLMVVHPGTAHEAVKVMDFGFAGFSAKPHLQLAELTGHGPIYAIGTPGYVSPEMIRGDTVDGRSDLYSVGVVLFELLTGRLPFDHHETHEGLLRAHVKEPPPRLRDLGYDPGPAVEGVVQLALAKYPNERHQSARELAVEFGRAVGEDVWAMTSPVGWEPPAKPAFDRTPTPMGRQSPLAADPLRIAHRFQVLMPERMAGAKIRGFMEDIGGEVVESEPGLVRLRVGLPRGYRPPTKSSGVMGWLNAIRQPGVTAGQEPIEIELAMEKPDPGQARLSVTAAYGPIRDYRPKDATLWRTRVDKLNAMLRQYLGA